MGEFHKWIDSLIRFKIHNTKTNLQRSIRNIWNNAGFGVSATTWTIKSGRHFEVIHDSVWIYRQKDVSNRKCAQHIKKLNLNKFIKNKKHQKNPTVLLWNRPLWLLVDALKSEPESLHQSGPNSFTCVNVAFFCCCWRLLFYISLSIVRSTNICQKRS